MEIPPKPFKFLRENGSLPRFSESFDTKKEYSQSLELIHSLEEWLDRTGTFGQFRPVDFDEKEVAGDSFLKENQAVAALSVIPRTFDHNLSYGLIHPEDKILIGKRSLQSRWEPGTWTIPMGKIEAQDHVGPEDTIKEVVSRAAYREMEEEVVMRPVLSSSLYLDGFEDISTNFTVHIIATRIRGLLGSDGSIAVGLPSLREHSNLGWVYLKDLPECEPMSNGMKFLLKRTLEQAANRNLAYSGQLFSKT